jgi:transcriptional regulator with XRE-family HTH domain
MPKKSGLVSPREREIGRRAHLVRERINWPQPAFAAELDISRDRLACVEYGRTPLRYSVGYRLCVLFDINPQWLADGTGEMKSALALANLPMPEGLPARAIFSRVYDQCRQRASAATNRAGARGRKKQEEIDLIPDFDATAHVIRSLSDLFAREKFRSPIERQEFALEITSYARDLALRLRRDAARERARAVSSRRGGSLGRQNDLSGISARNAKTVLRLREGTRRLDQEIGKLEAAMRRLNPVAVSPALLPRPAALEVVRLEEAMEKIAGQIEEAEAKISILMSSRTAADT